MDEIKTLEEFKKFIKLSNKIPILIDFYADWCMPCKTLSLLLERLEKKFDGKFKLIKINVEEYPEISMKFKVMSLPTVVLLKNENEIDRFVGTMSESEIISWFKRNKII